MSVFGEYHEAKHGLPIMHHRNSLLDSIKPTKDVLDSKGKPRVQILAIDENGVGKDPKTGGCLIYEDRPLVCRAYGKKYSLQCPYKGLSEQPKDEAKKKTLIMNNNGTLKDTIELKKLMFNKG